MAEPTGQAPRSEAIAGTTGVLDQLEKIAKILSLIAIPVVVAFFGWLVQNSLSQRNVSQEYVKLSISILKEPKDKIEPSLRDWAVDLLNQNSPTKFGAKAIEALKTGQATLPAQPNKGPVCLLRLPSGSWGACFLGNDGSYSQCQPYDGPLRQPLCG
jgi:hypothetical protein